MSNDSAAVPAPCLIAFEMRVLLLDDQIIIAEAIRRMLGDQPDIEFHYVTEAAQALETARRLQPTVILQDLVMPGIDGLELIRHYRRDAQLSQVPVIVMSAKEDPHMKADCFRVGANDYIVKLPDRVELVARIRYHSAAHISRLQRDQAFAFLRESQQNLAAANIELQKLAGLDGLTGIANRRRFDSTMQTEWQRGQREQKPLSLLFCDIDFFKVYNDTFGHLAGDVCLGQVAAVLGAQLKRPADLAARYGGEEFAVILPETELAGALALAQACLGALAALELPHATPAGRVTLSIGVACVVPSPAGSVTQLIRDADRALYAAKHGGRNQVCSAAALPASLITTT